MHPPPANQVDPPKPPSPDEKRSFRARLSETLAWLRTAVNEPRRNLDEVGSYSLQSFRMMNDDRTTPNYCSRHQATLDVTALIFFAMNQ